MQKFFDKVNKTEDCWLWKAATRNGYGTMKFEGRTVDAHRISYILHFGLIPEGMLVCHKCDVPLCVNPKHLFLGTYKDNMQDCIAKGRFVYFLPENGNKFKSGNVPTNSSLTREKAKQVKLAIENRGNKSLSKLAKELGLKHQLLRDISCGRIYKDMNCHS